MLDTVYLFTIQSATSSSISTHLNFPLIGFETKSYFLALSFVLLLLLFVFRALKPRIFGNNTKNKSQRKTGWMVKKGDDWE